ncbi:MAG: type II toxin-antitoxin system RelE/ParE family toxin [Candidatus Electrothrix sp. GW3-4]|uniref:type II toxin-antitoxin system RelE/ParE family toxin n=1 Tax=Candidatus Electrothrix sp. GW3-4 TaxID=3126740 RepID=UPI0030CC00BE
MPKYSVDLHPDVYPELEYSRTWYERQATNLGIKFLNEVDQAIETVRDSPEIWPLLDKDSGIRRYIIHRFPYGLIYRVKETVIQVIAVMHLHRQPDYWRERV